MSRHTDDILSRFDAGETPVQIIAALAAAGVSKRVVYAVLRKHRPERVRAPRRRTSTIPARVRQMSGEGIAVARIADLLQVTSVYVYRILADQ
ncbi:hypothetical protein ACRAVF_19205 [Bradyrhizobium oligotrophicum S58]